MLKKLNIFMLMATIMGFILTPVTFAEQPGPVTGIFNNDAAGVVSENKDKPEIHGGFARSHWCGNDQCEERIKDDLSVTIRCIPFDSKEEKGNCIFCGESSDRRVIFAKAY